jgi:alkylhydroperoxidase family enzyme
MSHIAQLRAALVTRILEGEGRASPGQRRAAFDDVGVAAPVGALVDKVARRAHAVSDADIAAARTSGLKEDQIFELVVCAAIGQATRQYDAALGALETAIARG